MTEAQLQQAVLDLAKYTGWLVYHTYDSRRSAAGFPDLVLVRERVVFAELKSDGGRLSRFQKRWIEALLAAGQEVYVWTPRVLTTQIPAVLARPRHP